MDSAIATALEYCPVIGSKRTVAKELTLDLAREIGYAFIPKMFVNKIEGSR